MKTLITALFIFSFNHSQAQEIDRKTDVNFSIHNIMNAPVKDISLQELKGKLVLLDFWATWCGACVQSLPHLNALQHKYKKELQIIELNNEGINRTKLFINKRPSQLWFANDSNDVIAGMFPHQLIPHAVLISKDGTIISQTDPESITVAVIDSLLNGLSVHLPEKKDNLLNYEDIINQVFFASDTVQERFLIQPEIKGAPGVSKNYSNNVVFKDRRQTCINLPLTTLYRLAYGNFPSKRFIDNTHSVKSNIPYCLDIIVKKKEDLLPEFQKQLNSRFGLKASVIETTSDVLLLTIKDENKFKLLTRNTSGGKTFYARHGEIDQQNITMKDFASYLENYCLDELVVDESHNTEKFDIKFTFQPEDPNSLKQILQNMGLQLIKGKRKIKMLKLGE